MRTCVLRDELLGVDGTSRTKTPEGYLLAPATIARVGVQAYLPRELGMQGDAPVRLYRPADEVFSPEAVASFENKPVTDGHPSEDVTAENWSRLGRGEVRDVVATSSKLVAQVVIKDAALVKKVEAGRNPLSCGYTFALDETPGRTPEGEPYDGVMRNIRGNHVAVVGRARGGPECRIADGEKPMQKIVVDGATFDFEDSAADVVTKLVSERDAARKAADSAGETLAATLAEKETLTKALDEAKALASPEAIKAHVIATTVATEQAKAIGVTIADGIDAQAIRIAILGGVTDAPLVAVRDAILGGIAVDAADEALATRTVAALGAVAKSTRRAGDQVLASALTSSTPQAGAAAIPAVGLKSGADLQREAISSAWRIK